jgi:hypothetical protein
MNEERLRVWPAQLHMTIATPSPAKHRQDRLLASAEQHSRSYRAHREQTPQLLAVARDSCYGTSRTDRNFVNAPHGAKAGFEPHALRPGILVLAEFRRGVQTVSKICIQELLMPLPLCFVAMPFGKKPAAGGRLIDFDAVYAQIIAPALRDANLDPLRADEEQAGGIIHKPMFERLILCEYAVADLTNANVFYELGVRHAVRSACTVLLFAVDCGQLPFDVAPLRAVPYQLGPDGKPSEAEKARSILAQRLRAPGDESKDSPLYQMVDGFPDIQRLKTDVFRDRVQYSEQKKADLASARKQGTADAIRKVESSLGDISDADSGVVIDLFLSFRAVEAWPQMIDLVARMSPALAATVMVREQFALALNRDGRGDEAETVLLDVIARRGPSSETYGILGRIYKDRWEAAQKEGNAALARGLLTKAIDAYLKGFEADWRDAYPGINAVTLMHLKDPPDPRAARLIPVVGYAVQRRIASGKPDYWDYATLLELAVLAGEEQAAADALADALANVRETWEPETTARNLRLTGDARERRGQPLSWTKEIENALTAASEK